MAASRKLYVAVAAAMRKQLEQEMIEKAKVA